MLKVDSRIVWISLYDNLLIPYLFFLCSLLVGGIFIYGLEPLTGTQGAYLGGFAGGLYAFLFGVYAYKLEKNTDLIKKYKDELIQLERKLVLIFSSVNFNLQNIDAMVDLLKPNLTSPELHIYTNFNRLHELIELDFIKNDIQDLVLLNYMASFSLTLKGINRSIQDLNQVNQELRVFGLSQPSHAAIYKNNIKSLIENLQDFAKQLNSIKLPIIQLQAYSRRMSTEIPSSWWIRHFVRYTAFSLEDESFNQEVAKLKEEYQYEIESDAVKL